MNNKYKRWTKEEEERLLQQVRTFPQNLTKCFFIVSEVIDRTPGAISQHWYSTLSKRPDVVCFFTASQDTLSKNRKNSEGVKCKRNIWQRLLTIISKII